MVLTAESGRQKECEHILSTSHNIYLLGFMTARVKSMKLVLEEKKRNWVAKARIKYKISFS